MNVRIPRPPVLCTSYRRVNDVTNLRPPSSWWDSRRMKLSSHVWHSMSLLLREWRDETSGGLELARLMNVLRWFQAVLLCRTMRQRFGCARRIRISHAARPRRLFTVHSGCKYGKVMCIYTTIPCI
jgi:hypothetical protein